MGAKKVALLDAGAQLEKVIMRRVLESGYDIDKFPADALPSQIKDYDAIIISGGPRSVYDANSLLPNPGIYNMGKPILGICYGLQAVAHQLGGKVVNGIKGQYGRNQIHISKREDIFSGLSSEERVLMSHFDTVKKTPDGFSVYAESEGLVAAIGNKEKNIYAVQFHPELVPVTKNGAKIFENFFSNVCRFPAEEKRSIKKEIEYSKKLITDAAGKDKYVMQYWSGGVDSTVMCILLAQCIEPERLHIRTLSHPGMRAGEIKEIEAMAEKLNLPNFQVIDAEERVYNAMREIQTKKGNLLAGPLCYTIEPEEKRKIFGTEYAVIALTEMAKIANECRIPIENILLGQGSLRPDMIESGNKRVTKGEAHTIKTHHNAVSALEGIPKIEPLIELFKDQVRLIALELGLDESFAYRQPFPGPGLYCRIIGSHEFAPDDDFLTLDRKVNSAAERFNAHVLPVKTVGVQGDERSYKYPVIVSGEIDWKEFAELALNLPNEIKEINRVLYTPGKPVTLEQAVSITPTLMTKDVFQQSKACDAAMRDIAEKYGFNDSRVCSQMPGILIPSNFGEKGKRSFVIRPALTLDFMAIIGMMPCKTEPEENKEEFFPEEMFFEMAEETPKKDRNISRVILDASDKPPASTEWE